MTTGLFLGRFQPFHNGHLSAIRESARKADELYVGIGSSQELGTEKNPFAAEQRRRMIEAATEDIPNIKIVLIPDVPGDDEKWLEEIEEKYPRFDVIFTGNPETGKLFSEHGYRVVRVTIVPDVSGTKIRALMGRGEDWDELVPDSTAQIIRE